VKVKKMLEALWGLEFGSNLNDGGYGVVVLETGRVLGGDSSFIYVGSYELNNGVVTAQVKCTNDRKSLTSVFGDIAEFNLHLEGTPSHDQFILQGHMIENPSMKIEVKFTRRAELP
jgi:T3SS negative regulator,GrlR